MQKPAHETIQIKTRHPKEIISHTVSNSLGTECIFRNTGSSRIEGFFLPLTFAAAFALAFGADFALAFGADFAFGDAFAFAWLLAFAAAALRFGAAATSVVSWFISASLPLGTTSPEASSAVRDFTSAKSSSAVGDLTSPKASSSEATSAVSDFISKSPSAVADFISSSPIIEASWCACAGDMYNCLLVLHKNMDQIA